MATRQEWYTTGDDQDGANGDGVVVGQWRGQSFTIGNTGGNLTFNLTDVNIKLSVSGILNTEDDLTIDLHNADPAGFPTGTAISTGTLLKEDVADSPAWYNITMSSATLTAGRQYALVFSSPATTTVGMAYDIRTDASASAYTGGTFLTSTDGGATWATYAGDAMFEINGGSYTGTLCTLADAVNKAGANANAGATEEVLVSDFVRQAEGLINAVTRFNWVDAYSTLTDEVKFILNKTTSVIAAIDIIAYDPSGFTDIVEAETIINVHRETMQMGLSLLRNQEVRTFMVGDT